MVHVLPPFNVPVHGLAPLGVATYEPLPVMLVKVMATVPVFLTVTVFALGVLSATLPKPSVAGVKVKGAVDPFWPVPVNPPVRRYPEVGIMVKAPLIVPLIVGVKVIPNVHLLRAFRVPLHGLVPFPTAEKSPLVL